MGGMRMSPTNDVIIRPKAAPMMMPKAISRTFPRIANSLNSFSIGLLKKSSPASAESGPNEDSARIEKHRFWQEISGNRTPWQDNKRVTATVGGNLDSDDAG